MSLSSLRDALDDARAAGVAPVRYAALLHQHWLVVATHNAGIDLARWNPRGGARVNADTFEAVYANYLRLAHAHPGFYWVGLAGLAAAPFVGGMADLNGLTAAIDRPLIRRVMATIDFVVSSGRLPGLQNLPSDIRATLRGASKLSAQDLRWFQIRLMIMQKHIYTDVVSQHEAFLIAGMAGVEEMYQARMIDDNARTAWRGIASGRHAGFADALVRIADREQNQIVAEQWDATAAGRSGMGRVMCYASTVVAQPIIPGVRAPGIYAPTMATAKFAGRNLSLRLPLPALCWADRVPRWHYILHDFIPRYLEMMHQPSYAAAVLGAPFLDIVAQGKVVNRLPDLAANFTAQWQVTWT
ncbi:hypothetical protein [Nocardia sp. NPDC003963]